METSIESPQNKHLDKAEPQYDLGHSLLGISPEEETSISLRHSYANCSIICNSQ